MIFDTDILIWAERGNVRAVQLIENSEQRFVSIQTYMELIQGARSHAEMRTIKDFFSKALFQTLPLTENIGHRALIYVEEYALASAMRAGDAIIAATAVENNLTLATSNQKHYRSVKDLKIKVFNP